MKKITPLGDEWKRFSQAVINDGAPPVQLQEMNLAFFAGAMAFRSVLSMSSDLPDEQIDLVMAAVERELDESYAIHMERLTVEPEQR